MAKKVFQSYDDVAHLWAHQAQEEARCRSMYFEGTKIYSYGSHFEIARVVKTILGNTIILWNNGTYSSTTSTHQWAVRRAIPNEQTVLFMESDKDFFSTNMEGKVQMSFSMYRAFLRLFGESMTKIIEWSKKQKRARTNDYREQVRGIICNLRIAYREYQLGQSHRLTGTGKERVKPLLEYMQIKTPKRNYWQVDRGYIGGQHVDVMKGKRDVWLIAKLVEMSVFDMATATEFVNPNIPLDVVDEIFQYIYEHEGQHVEDYSKMVKRLEKESARRQAQAVKERKIKFEEDLVKWRDGENVWLSNPENLDSAYLRVVTISVKLLPPSRRIEQEYVTLVETSKSIRLTIEEAERMWKFWSAVVKKGKAFTHELVLDANGSKWKVQYVDEQGRLKAGCHLVEFAEAERIAKKLNFNIE